MSDGVSTTTDFASVAETTGKRAGTVSRELRREGRAPAFGAEEDSMDEAGADEGDVSTLSQEGTLADVAAVVARDCG